MRKTIVTVIAVLSMTGAAHADPTISVNVGALAGANKATVATALGKPEQCEPSKYGERCTYAGKHEVIYINGKADWITAYVDAPFAVDAVAQVGLAPTGAPATANTNVIRWNPTMWEVTKPSAETAKGLRPGETVAIPIESVAIFPRGPKTDYVYIKVSTR